MESKTTNRILRSKKGQYFSFDAIVAAVIFVMAISILTGHWFSLRAQMDEQTLFLQDEAIRLSEIFVSPGDYDVPVLLGTDKVPWYMQPKTAKKAGFGKNGSFEGDLIYEFGAGHKLSILAAENYLKEGVNYEDSRLLLATPVHYYATFNLSVLNKDDFTYYVSPEVRPREVEVLPINVQIGKAPSPHAETVKIIRPVAATTKITLNTVPPQEKIAFYSGSMTLYVWSDSRRG